MKNLATALVLALASVVGSTVPVAGETPDANFCASIWSAAKAATGDATLEGSLLGVRDGWCLVRNPGFNQTGKYAPDWFAEELWFSGDAARMVQGGLAGADGPQRLDVRISGLYIAAQPGDPALDYLLRTQARSGVMAAALSAVWEPATRVLTIERFHIDMAGDNAIALAAKVANVDLSSSGALQMAATGFAVTELDLTLDMFGLFEMYGLPSLLNGLGAFDSAEPEAEMARLKAEATEVIGQLPDSSFDAKSRAALAALVSDLPNPAGRLSLHLTSKAGFGPARFGAFLVNGMPQDVADAAPLFEGVRFDFDWARGPVN